MPYTFAQLKKTILTNKDAFEWFIEICEIADQGRERVSFYICSERASKQYILAVDKLAKDVFKEYKREP